MAKEPELKLKISADGKAAVAQLGTVDKAVADVGAEANDTSQELAGMFGRLAAGALSVDALRRFGTALAEAGMRAQDMRSRLDFAAGSAQEADRQLKILTDTAAANGQGVAAMVDAYVTLKNLGLDPSREALEAYLNVAAASGKSLDQFVQAVADAVTGQFERLKEFGIKAGIEGDKVAVRFRGSTRLIQNDAKSIEQALQDIGRKDFAGAVAAQSQNASVALNTMGDAIDRLAAKMAADSGLNQGIANTAKSVTRLADALSAPAAEGSIANVFATIVASVTDNVAALGSAYLGASDTLADFILWLKKGKPDLDDWSASALAAAHEVDKLARSEAGLIAQRKAAADAATWRAEAERGVTSALIGQANARQAALAGQAAYARAVGDETAALIAQAAAAEETAAAKRLAAESADQAVEAARRDLVALESVGKARTKEAEQLREVIPQLQQKAIVARQASDASQAEVLSAQLAAETYGDQSSRLAELIAWKQRLIAEIQAEGAASAAAAPALRELAEANALIADAAGDAAKNIELDIQANERGLTVAQARLALEADEANRLAARATARGRDIEALYRSADAVLADAKATELASDAKARDAELLAERARLLELAGQATGDYTREEQAQVAAMRDAAELAGIEAERMQVAAKAKRDAADETQRLAEQQARLKVAFEGAGLAGVRSMEDVRAAIARAGTGPELDALAQGLAAAIQAGVDKASELSAALKEVEAKMETLDSWQGKTFNYTLTPEAMAKKYKPGESQKVAQEFMSAWGNAPGIGTVSQGASALVKAVQEIWMKEYVPPPAVPPVQSTRRVVDINLHGGGETATVTAASDAEAERVIRVLQSAQRGAT